MKRIQIILLCSLVIATGFNLAVDYASSVLAYNPSGYRPDISVGRTGSTPVLVGRATAIDGYVVGRGTSEITKTPTVVPSSQTAYHFILNGDITSMGVINSANCAFRWGFSPDAMVNVVSTGVASGAGSFSASIGDVLAGTTVYFQFYVTIGSLSSNGDVQSYTVAITPTVSLSALLPLFVLLIGIIFILKAMINNKISGIAGLLSVFVAILIMVAIAASTNTIVMTP